MRIKVIDVSDVQKEKSYFFYTLTYEKDGKEETKKVYSFSEAAYTALKAAKKGELYDINLAKNKNGYWEWSEVMTAKAGESTPATTRSGSWETPEERARRQVLIVRQSSLAQSVAFVGVGEQNVENLLEIAAQFEAWVNRD
jgi:hypothetical protein